MIRAATNPDELVSWGHAPTRELAEKAAHDEVRKLVGLAQQVGDPFGGPSTPGESKATASLTAKELAVLELVSLGYGNQAIAKHLQVARQAVKNSLRIIQLKFGANNRAHAASVCLRKGLLPLKD